MKTLIVVPCFNEEKKIGQVIDDIRTHNIDFIIVNDGSTDESAKIINKKKANVIYQLKNLGKGAALTRGFEYALSHGYDAIITLDSDGQHNTDEIESFIQNAPGTDIIIGNRLNNMKNMPLSRRFANKVSSFLISCLSRQKIYDSQCGFRLIRTKVLKKVCIKDSRFFAETEILLKASRLGFKIKNLPIDCIYADEISAFKPIEDTCKFIVNCLKNL
jgi:glycosyltransferase involved in cell wall biosynthesis